MEQRFDTEKTQTYEEFMAGIKRKTPLPKELKVDFRFMKNDFMNKREIKKLVMEGKIKINYKAPYMSVKHALGSKIYVSKAKRPNSDQFELWWCFWKRIHSVTRPRPLNETPESWKEILTWLYYETGKKIYNSPDHFQNI